MSQNVQNIFFTQSAKNIFPLFDADYQVFFPPNLPLFTIKKIVNNGIFTIKIFFRKNNSPPLGEMSFSKEVCQ